LAVFEVTKELLEKLPQVLLLKVPLVRAGRTRLYNHLLSQFLYPVDDLVVGHLSLSRLPDETVRFLKKRIGLHRQVGVILRTDRMLRDLAGHDKWVGSAPFVSTGSQDPEE
jgi:hypothetical protein